MGVKIEPLARLLSGFLSYFTHNSNADKIEAAFQNTLSRDGSDPNQMAAPLDMGSNRIINVGAPKDLNDAVRLADVTGNVPVTLSTDWNDLTNKPATFPPSSHSHAESDITGLTTDLAGKSNVGHTHTTGDVIGLDNEIDLRVVGHTLVQGTNVTLTPQSGGTQMRIDASASSSTAWSSLTGVPSTFPPSAHTHPESDITSLVSDLAGKAAITHSHSTADITGLDSHTRGLFSATGTGLTYNSGTGVFTFSGGGGFPYQMYPAWENGITTGNTASTNASNLQSLINTLTGNGGGIIWFFAPGPYQIDSTITLKSKVQIRMSPGAYFSWQGSSGGTIFTTPTGSVLTECYADLFVNEGNSFSGIVFNLHSAYHNEFHLLGFGTHTTGGYWMKLQANSSAYQSPFTDANIAFNKIKGTHFGVPYTGIWTEGVTSGVNSNPQVVTLNDFQNIQIAGGCGFRGIKLENWSDSNTFSGNTRVNMTGSGSIGVMVNEGRANNFSVYNTHWEHLAVDTFGTGLNRYGVVLNESKGMTCDQFYQQPQAENGSFVGTNCTSYEFRELDGSDHLTYRRKNVF